MPDKPNQTQGNCCDLLPAYELGLLEKDECLVFENHLVNCIECTDELYEMAPTAAAMTAQPGLYAEQVGRSLHSESIFTRLNRMFFTGPSKVLLPVAVAAIFALLIFMPQSSETKFRSLAMTEAPAFSPLQVRAGTQDQWLPLWESGMQHYQVGDFDLAADDLHQAVNLLAMDPANQQERYTILDNARLYLGVSQLISGLEEESITALTLAAQSQLPPVQQKAQWYLAQAYLIGEQPEAALPVLEELQTSPVFGSPAKELMMEIEALMQR